MAVGDPMGGPLKVGTLGFPGSAREIMNENPSSQNKIPKKSYLPVGGVLSFLFARA